jgi:hypothetical protein
MQDWILISSLNGQNMIVSNAKIVPSCRSFSGWIGDRGCATNVFVSSLLQKSLTSIGLTVQC